MFPMTPTLRAALERQRAHTRAIEHATGQVIPWAFHRDGQPMSVDEMKRLASRLNVVV